MCRPLDLIFQRQRRACKWFTWFIHVCQLSVFVYHPQLSAGSRNLLNRFRKHQFRAGWRLTCRTNEMNGQDFQICLFIFAYKWKNESVPYKEFSFVIWWAAAWHFIDNPLNRGRCASTCESLFLHYLQIGRNISHKTSWSISEMSRVCFFSQSGSDSQIMYVFEVGQRRKT